MRFLKKKIIALLCAMFVSVFVISGFAPADVSIAIRNAPEETTVTQHDETSTKTEDANLQAEETTITVDESAESAKKDMLSREGYELEQVVVLSRHNIRSPLSGNGSVLDTMTPHKWIEWSSDPSDLSLRGGVLETEMGQFFRKWLEEEGLFPENYQPSDEVRVYANSKQRTIATANLFLTGLLPVSNTDVESHVEFDEMDPVFNPQLTFMSDDYKELSEKQIIKMFSEKIESLSDNYELLSEVLDVKESQDFKDGKFTGFKTDDTEFVLEKDKEPGLTGSLKTACSLSDALVLQYYEGNDEEQAFGKKLSKEEWEKIAEIKDIYQDALFSAPLVAVNVAHPLIGEILSELKNENRKFTFLCGHDSNLGSVLAALAADEYDLPEALEKKTPIGCKLVFCKWKDKAGEEYMSLDLVYQTKDQQRGLSLLDTDNPPAVTHIGLQGLKANEDGLYKAAQVEERLQKAYDQYDKLEELKKSENSAVKSTSSKAGIIGAMEEEVETLKSSMTDKNVTEISGMEFCEGKLEGKDVVVVKCNMGKVNAGICAQTLIREFKVDRVINTGVAGSLEAKIDIGDIVVSTETVQHDYDFTPMGSKPGEMPDIGVTAISADEGLRTAAVQAVKESAPEVNAFEGRICTGDQFIASKEQREKIIDAFGGLCCEMEGGAIAQACYLNNTPFVIIRAISDKADDSEEMSYQAFEKIAAKHCAGIVEYMVTHLD